MNKIEGKRNLTKSEFFLTMRCFFELKYGLLGVLQFMGIGFWGVFRATLTIMKLTIAKLVKAKSC